jgi:hypothetical protein
MITIDEQDRSFNAWVEKTIIELMMAVMMTEDGRFASEAGIVAYLSRHQPENQWAAKAWNVLGRGSQERVVRSVVDHLVKRGAVLVKRTTDESGRLLVLGTVLDELAAVLD